MTDRFIEIGLSTSLQIEVCHGVDWIDSFQLYQPQLLGSQLYDPAIYDLAGVRQKFTIQTRFNNPSIIIDTLDTLTGEFATGDVGGVADIYVPGWRVATWPRGQWAFIWVASKDGNESEIARGQILVHPGP